MTSHAALLKLTHFQPPNDDGIWRDEDWPAHHAALEAAHEVCKTYTRLYTRRGTRAHLSPPFGPRRVLCDMLPAWPGEWLGTGSQREYETAAELETCSRCRDLFMLAQRCGNPRCPCHGPFEAEAAGLRDGPQEGTATAHAPASDHGARTRRATRSRQGYSPHRLRLDSRPDSHRMPRARDQTFR